MIVIPMAGLSRRFELAGHSLPKYMLPLWGKYVFDWAVSSFLENFEGQRFLFITRDIHQTEAFVGARCRELGIERYEIVVLSHVTRGQAETVMEGLSRSTHAAEDPVTIFNIDTFRPRFTYPDRFDVSLVDGYLEVFRGSGANWSYVREGTARPYGVAETAEKREISDLCCTGLYHFRRADLFEQAYAARARRDPRELSESELYVAPLYNELIKAGHDIRYSPVPRESVIFCGTPAEYEELIREGHGAYPRPHRK